MVQDFDTTSFYRDNLQDLQRFITYSGLPQSDSSDITQDFFHYNLTHDSLAQWDSSRSSYSTYVFTVLRWQMNPYVKYNKIPHVNLPAEITSPETSDLSIRVSNLVHYIRKHGGDYTIRLLAHLRKRINGEALTEEDKYIEIKWHKIIRDFKLAEELY